MPISAKKNSLSGVAFFRRSSKPAWPSLRTIESGSSPSGRNRKHRLASVAHARQHRFDRAPRGLASGAIAVEAEIDVRALAKQNLGVIACRRRAERRDGLRHAELVQADHVHVAFDDDQARNLLMRLAHLPEAEQFAALVEQRRLRRIEIFRAR